MNKKNGKRKDSGDDNSGGFKNCPILFLIFLSNLCVLLMLIALLQINDTTRNNLTIVENSPDLDPTLKKAKT